MKNIELVDKGVERITTLIENFYNNDGKTVYILTSDHGMTPWGAHGTGLPTETETPFIGWGAGITKPIKLRNVNKDSQSMMWGLKDFKRTDLNQIDLAPLMSYLIGKLFKRFLSCGSKEIIVNEKRKNFFLPTMYQVLVYLKSWLHETASMTYRVYQRRLVRANFLFINKYSTDW